MHVIPPTQRQREIELQVIAKYDKEAKQAIKRNLKYHGKKRK